MSHDISRDYAVRACHHVCAFREICRRSHIKPDPGKFRLFNCLGCSGIMRGFSHRGGMVLLLGHKKYFKGDSWSDRNFSNNSVIVACGLGFTIWLSHGADKLVRRADRSFLAAYRYLSMEAPFPATLGLTLDKLWNWPLEVIGGWITQLVNPFELVRRCIQENSESGWTGVFGKYWGFPIAFSIAIDAVLILSAYGFNLQSQAPALFLYFIWASTKWLIAVAAVHLSLRLLRLTSNVGIIVSCYTIMVAYAPFLSLLESPATYHQIEILSLLKAQHLDFIGSMKFIFGHVDELKQSEFQSRIMQLSFQLEGALFLILNVLVAENLSPYLLNDKFKTYLALWFSSFVSFIPSGVLAVFWDVIVYRNIS
jgi:hypothetical protein